MIFQQSFPPYTPPFEPPQPPTPSPPQPISLPPLDPVIQPLRWLWPGRIPLGKLSLLDGSPHCGTSLFALTLAAHVSTGRPWPDGSPCPQGTVLFLSPHESFRDTVLPRLHAAGADDGRVLSFSQVSDTSSTDPHARRPFSLARDLPFLEAMITDAHVILLILDPYTAFPGWRRALPALIELAARTHCAIVFTRSLSHAPSDLLHPHCPASPVLTAARSHLLLAPDPRDERHCLLLTPKHPLCPAPPLLAYSITSTQDNLPLLSWLPAPDPAQLHRLATGPLRSPQRLAILRFLRQQPAACPLHTILEATSYDYAAGRKMLLRMSHAGELVSLDRGLYTTADHPCLATLPPDSPPPPPSSPVPNVPNVPAVPNDSSIPTEQSEGASAEQSEVLLNPSCPSPVNRLPTELNTPQKQSFDHLIASGGATLAPLPAHLLASGSPVPTISLPNVPCPNPSQVAEFLRLSGTPTSQKNIPPVPDVPTPSNHHAPHSP